MKNCICIIVIMAGSAASANCVPPFMPVFACTILTADQRVEICATPPDENGVSDTFSYNFATGMEMSELYFETDNNRFSMKYYRPDVEGVKTIGLGLVHGSHVYSVHVTGIIHSEFVSAAQLHVHDDIAAFESDRGETEILRLYCDPDTVRVNWDFIRP